jgi:hypothetical protein
MCLVQTTLLHPGSSNASQPDGSTPRQINPLPGNRFSRAGPITPLDDGGPYMCSTRTDEYQHFLLQPVFEHLFCSATQYYPWIPIRARIVRTDQPSAILFGAISPWDRWSVWIHPLRNVNYTLPITRHYGFRHAPVYASRRGELPGLVFPDRKPQRRDLQRLLQPFQRDLWLSCPSARRPHAGRADRQ